MISRIASSALAVGAAIVAGAVYTRGRSRTATLAKDTAVSPEPPSQEEAPREIGAANLDRMPSALSLQEIYNRVSFM